MSSATVLWILWGLAFFAIEIPGIVLNERYGEDHEYRTLTENLRWLFATDKAGARARWRRLRRFFGLAAVVWLAVHLMVSNWV